MTPKARPRAEKQPRRVALSAGAKADRITRRRTLGKSLPELRVAETTERRYTLAYCRLCAFIALHFLGPIGSFWELDKVISTYLSHIYEEGEPKSWGNDTVAGVQFYIPAARHRLGLAWSLVKTWHRHEMPARALPFTIELLSGFAGALVASSYPLLAAGAVVGFSLLLRTSELLNLTFDDVAISMAKREAVVRLRETKAGGRMGIHQSVVVRDAPTLSALHYLCKQRKAGERLLQCDDKTLRRLCAHCVACLGMQSLAIRPYSMRRGGATQLFRSCLSYDVVSDRGRWHNVATCRRYVEDGAAQLASLRLSEWQEAQVKALGALYRQFAAAHFDSSPPAGVLAALS